MLLKKVYLRFRKYKISFYKRILSKKIKSYPAINMPTIFEGNGRITIDRSAVFGWYLSPNYYEGYNYIEARDPESSISIGEKSVFNNNFSIIAAGRSKITIGRNLKAGSNLLIISSDFHGIKVKDRNLPGISEDVTINDNVFIGNNVVILKGVTVGENSVIGVSSVVTKDVPANSIVAGNPAKIISLDI